MNEQFHPHGDMVIYQAEDGKTHIDIKLEDGSLWLTQAQIVTLYQSSKSNISEHIRHIFEDGELQENSVVRSFRTAAADGKSYDTNYYHFQMIIAIGYRVRSNIGAHFRNWATHILEEYIQKGFALDDERLKQLGGGDYWKELLDRIRDIRSSEKVMYRQILDLYATSIDYEPSSNETVRFFQTVQNKLHFAAHGHTAAEVIYARADADKPYMGLTSFSGEHPIAKDAQIAKNYLSAEELKLLNNLVSGYFDFAEIQAMRHQAMTMKDYANHLDTILAATGEDVLQGSGSISHKQASEKATQEYRRYQAQNLSPVEQAYLTQINAMEKLAKSKTGEPK
ncbi:MAG: virulence RhuM family protein [Clostridia bacterium]